MSNGWKDILKRAGDETAGQALIRLARQAAALHQAEMAARCSEDAAMRVQGSDLRPRVRLPDGSPEHKEVLR